MDIRKREEAVRPYQIMGELQTDGLERMLRPVVILRKVVGVDEGGLHVFSDYHYLHTCRSCSFGELFVGYNFPQLSLFPLLHLV